MAGRVTSNRTAISPAGIRCSRTSARIARRRGSARARGRDPSHYVSCALRKGSTTVRDRRSHGVGSPDSGVGRAGGNRTRAGATEADGSEYYKRVGAGAERRPATERRYHQHDRYPIEPAPSDRPDCFPGRTPSIDAQTGSHTLRIRVSGLPGAFPCPPSRSPRATAQVLRIHVRSHRDRRQAIPRRGRHGARGRVARRRAGQSITLDRVLLVADGDESAIGRPLVADAAVSAEVLRQTRGEKLISFKYRPKARSRVKKGHRQELTVLRITDVRLGQKSAAEAVRKAEADAKSERQHLEEAAAKQAAADAALAAKLAKSAAAEEKATKSRSEAEGIGRREASSEEARRQGVGRRREAQEGCSEDGCDRQAGTQEDHPREEGRVRAHGTQEGRRQRQERPR